MTETSNTDAGQTEDLVIYDFDPRNLPTEYLRAVGLVAMAAAQTESIVGQLIGALVRADNIETLALCAHMTGPLKDHVARSLLEMRAPHSGAVDDVDDLLDAIQEAMAKRNALVHNPLIRHPTKEQVFSHRLKARGSLQLELRPISVQEIEEEAALIYEAGIALGGYMLLHGLRPGDHPAPIREPLDRSKKAREKRRKLANRGGI